MDCDTTCCFTGHRPEKLPWRNREEDPRCLALKARIERELEEAYRAGYRHFICGMAQGADFYFCEAALALRDRRAGVTVEAAIPCEEQCARWSEGARNRYFDLVGHCDRETMVQRHYAGDACSGATAIWWTAPPVSSPCTTGCCWGGLCIPSPTP